ncbi:hypothetical protein ACHAXS_001555, partial [Conticribra weissflogii]
MNFSTILSIAIFGSASAFIPSPVSFTRTGVTTNMVSTEGEFYIDQNRRNLMNLILVGSAAVTVGGIAVPYVTFFVPPGAAGGTGVTPA